MYWIDILIVTILLVFFLIGISRGLISQIFSLAAVVGGIISGVLFYDLAGKVLIANNLIESESTAMLIGFILIVVIAFIVIQLLGWFAALLIGKLKLGWLNRLAGGVVGILIGVVIISLAFSWLNVTAGPTVKKSRFLPYVKNAYNTIIVLIPDDLRKGYEQAEKRVREESKKTIRHIEKSDKPESLDLGK